VNSEGFDPQHATKWGFPTLRKSDFNNLWSQLLVELSNFSQTDSIYLLPALKWQPKAGHFPALGRLLGQQGIFRTDTS
jgi:hypothetical protein